MYSAVVKRVSLPVVWPFVSQGLEEYRKKNPHHTPTAAELHHNLATPGGDELFVFGTAEGPAGFMTFKVQQLEPNERWGTIAIIYIEPRFWHTDVLARAAEDLAEELRGRGCQVMNYMTAREGFKRLAPRLGFRPRIIEWMKEL